MIHGVQNQTEIMKSYRNRFVLNGMAVNLSLSHVLAVVRLDAWTPAYHAHVSLHMLVVVQFCWPCLQENAPEQQIFWQYISRTSI